LLGKHPFLNANGTVNHKKQGSGKYEKLKEGKYSLALINLMERMMDVDIYMLKKIIIYFIIKVIICIDLFYFK
jgi:hypothetical protein